MHMCGKAKSQNTASVAMYLMVPKSHGVCVVACAVALQGGEEFQCLSQTHYLIHRR